MIKRGCIAGSLLLLLFAIAECIARFVLGLGTPPLSIAHPQIEYMLAPDQNLSRFHNTFITNHYGMRSRNPDQASDRYRVLVFGDSVINGGSLTDQSELATSILEHNLGEGIFVGNVSAGSWGPPNLLAYVENYGVFDADTAIIVMSAGDLCDLPLFEPLDPRTHPTETPLLAFGELVLIYLPRYVKKIIAPYDRNIHRTLAQRENDCLASASTGLSALRRLIALFHASGTRATIIRHPAADEFIDANFNTRLIAYLRTGLDGTGVEYLDAKRFFVKHGAVEELYRDRIHVNEAGQALYADIFLEIVSSNMANAPD